MVTKKVVVVGDGACGKTCLSVVFSRNEFPEDHIPTIYDTYTKNVTLEDHNVELTIWDTAGEEEYDRLRPLSYSGANAILVCFSIDNPDSLANVVEKWAPELKHYCRRVPLILVGNKLDLRSDKTVIAGLRKYELQPVQYDEGMKICKKIKAEAYIECSAKYVMNVKEVFAKAAQVALNHKKQKSKSSWCLTAKCYS